MPSFLPFLAGGILLFFLFMYFVPVGLWVTAQVSNVKVGILQLVFMRIRKVPPSLVINALITANKAGIPVTSSDTVKPKYRSNAYPNFLTIGKIVSK